MLQGAAHEIGRLLNLGHTDWRYLLSGDANPASIYVLPDLNAEVRLMHPQDSVTNTYLIKPEWDIINPFTTP